MKISLITVCYNSQATIETTFQSVAEQSYKNLEYIVIDGGSIDGTLEIINRYNHIIDIRISEPDKGLYDAMNKGIALSSGEIIGIINSDDLFYDSNAIKKVMEKFKTDITLDSVYGDLYYVSRGDINNISRKWVSGFQRKFSQGWHPAHPTFYVKKIIYDRYGVFDLTFKIAADFELMLRFLEKYKISTAYLKEPLVKMRNGGKSNNNILSIYMQNLECLKAFHKNGIAVSNFAYPFKRIIPKIFQFAN